MFKKRLILLCLSVIMLLSVCGCDTNTSKPSLRLVIGYDDYEPYNYADADGEPAGMNVELATEACRRMGYTAVFKAIDWDEKDTLLENGEVDCLWSCFSMDGQKDRYTWVGPYMYSRQIVAVLETSPLYSLSDLDGKSVGVRVGEKAEAIFLEHADHNIPQVQNVYSLNSIDEMATALRSDYVDAIAGYAAAIREILQNDQIEFRFLEENLSQTPIGVAFLKNGNPELPAKLSKALDDMLADGTAKSILNGYGVDTDKALEGLDNV